MSGTTPSPPPTSQTTNEHNSPLQERPSGIDDILNAVDKAVEAEEEDRQRRAMAEVVYTTHGEVPSPPHSPNKENSFEGAENGDDFSDAEYEKDVGVARPVGADESSSSGDEGDDLFNPKLMEEDYLEGESSDYDIPNLINNDVEVNPDVDPYEARRKAEEQMDERDRELRHLRGEFSEESFDEGNDSGEAFNQMIEAKKKLEIEKLAMKEDKMQFVAPPVIVGLSEKEVGNRFKQRDVEKLPMDQLKMRMEDGELKLGHIEIAKIK
ncbi:hypothetical protein EIN_387140, partial [Entamoeba invadens IP1]